MKHRCNIVFIILKFNQHDAVMASVDKVSKALMRNHFDNDLLPWPIIAELFFKLL